MTSHEMLISYSTHCGHVHMDAVKKMGNEAGHSEELKWLEMMQSKQTGK